MTAALSGISVPDVYGYTTADLHALPDDGRRWELIDGSLIVSPSATIDHNTIALWIAKHPVGVEPVRRVRDRN